jgi:hypothetical protein
MTELAQIGAPSMRKAPAPAVSRPGRPRWRAKQSWPPIRWGVVALVLTVASALIVSGLWESSGRLEILAGIGILIVAGAWSISEFASSLEGLHGRIEGLAFEIESNARTINRLQGEVDSVRGAMRPAAGPAGTQHMSAALGGTGTVAGRPCSLLSDGSVVVQTLVGYRRFRTKEDAEAFVGGSNLQ